MHMRVRRRRLPLLLSLLVMSLVALGHRSRLQAWAMGMTPAKQSGEVAPELPAGTRNLDGAPMRLADLRGRVVLLHFWTFACGNCEHMQPWYAAWDERYRARGLSIIGVHTPELPHERDLGRLRQVVKEKNIRWPVIPDPGYLVWDAFGVKAWPTIFVLGKDGKIAQSFVGDDRAGDIEALIEKLL